MSDETSDSDLPFTCYLIDGREGLVDLHPSDNRRDWMQEPHESVPYRCLPLVMANQHGWELRTPVGFSASWDGGHGREAVEVAVDDGSAEWPQSHFGGGTITFEVYAVFRTPPGYNLWVSGPANRFKDGVQCMSALIETDWMPYPFSVTWKLTRPGLAVRFDAGDPICQLFPIERDGVERMMPETRTLSDIPELERQVKTGAFRRNAPLMVEQHEGTVDPSHKHQGWYSRGENPDGSQPDAAHQTNLKVRPFKK